MLMLQTLSSKICGGQCFHQRSCTGNPACLLCSIQWKSEATWSCQLLYFYMINVGTTAYRVINNLIKRATKPASSWTWNFVNMSFNDINWYHLFLNYKYNSLVRLPKHRHNYCDLMQICSEISWMSCLWTFQVGRWMNACFPCHDSQISDNLLQLT